MNKVEFAVRQLIPLLEKAGVLSAYIASTPEHRKLCSAEQILISNLFEQLVDFTKENDMDMQEIIEKTIRDIVAEQFENNDKLQERLAKLESIVDALLSNYAKNNVEEVLKGDNLIDQLHDIIDEKLQERLAKLESIVGELNATAYSHIRRFEALERTTSNNLSLRLISLEESVHNCVTRREARDVAYETVRDADLDELLGSYVKDKVEEVLHEALRSYVNHVKYRVEEVLKGDDLRDQLHDIIDERLERVEISLKVV